MPRVSPRGLVIAGVLMDAGRHRRARAPGRRGAGRGCLRIRTACIRAVSAGWVALPRVRCYGPGIHLATEFHIAKPSGWPTGKYKVEISTNGAVATAKEFVVN
jgi:hypothetical protein